MALEKNRLNRWAIIGPALSHEQVRLLGGVWNDLPLSTDLAPAHGQLALSLLSAVALMGCLIPEDFRPRNPNPAGRDSAPPGDYDPPGDFLIFQRGGGPEEAKLALADSYDEYISISDAS